MKWAPAIWAAHLEFSAWTRIPLSGNLQLINSLCHNQAHLVFHYILPPCHSHDLTFSTRWLTSQLDPIVYRLCESNCGAKLHQVHSPVTEALRFDHIPTLRGDDSTEVALVLLSISMESPSTNHQLSTFLCGFHNASLDLTMEPAGTFVWFNVWWDGLHMMKTNQNWYHKANRSTGTYIINWMAIERNCTIMVNRQEGRLSVSAFLKTNSEMTGKID